MTTSNVSIYLTDQQEALLGCGPFFQTDCDVDGIDLFNAEASVLLQSLPGFEGKPGRDALRRTGSSSSCRARAGPGDRATTAASTARRRRASDSEMAAVSANFAKFTALVGIAEGDEDCASTTRRPARRCAGFVALTGSQRPELRAGGNGRFGRRDFLWHGGGEALLFYPKRNVLGFSFDFAEDLTKTNWGVEFTWVERPPFASNTSRDLLQESDVYNLTISVDRPTFVNFLNAEPHVLLQRAALRPLPASLRPELHHERAAHRARDLRGHDRLLPGPPAALASSSSTT